ncbi:capsule assembly Wzi family protein [Mucilaginibacter sp.]|uniref:capsule assembly Wzi family protein n=1 Tax=Mucilaginibacter sp. TaxID=1882438 RepID=UPI0035BC7FDF
MKKTFLLTILIYTLASLSTKLKAQSVPVGGAFDDYYRRQQLLGKVDSSLSFTIRPLFSNSAIKTQDIFDPDSILRNNSWTQNSALTFAKGKGIVQILPLSWQQQFNSDHPFGWNDGAMIPAKGYQTLINGGFFFKYGPLTIQLKPEFVYAANPSFKGYLSGHINDLDLTSYYGYYNYIDQPERFGTGAYSKAFLGQSSIRLNFGAASIGLSNENIWWGPGIRNSLILSNNAPGFKHITINTTRPINIYIGKFEGQIIAGKLENSNYSLLSSSTLSTGTDLLFPKRNEWRYFAGFNLNYHPKWISGLTLGLTRTFNAYHSDISGIGGYIPFFVPYQKQTIANGDPFPRDQYTSLYARWLFTKAQAEIYFEYGLNDNSYNFRDFIGSPDHSRAYILGIRKMMPFGEAIDQRILLSAEMTQLSQSPDRLVREAGGWYIHNGVNQGHTNLGQVLGAGTGSGGNLQSIDLSWVSGFKKLGIGFERYEHDVDFYRTAFSDINGNSRKWVDIAIALQGEWNFKNLIFNANLQGIKSYNYEWTLKNYDPSKYYIPNNDVFNFHGELGVTYRF